MPSDDVLSRSAELPDAVLRYADHDAGLVDVHLPAEPLDGRRPRPLVVNVHGGFWRQEFDRTHARPYAEALVAHGFVVANVEYRRGPDAWTRTTADLDACLTALPGLLAGLGVETTTVTLTGHSAGGHLALWLANQPHPLDRVVALAPVARLRWAAEQRIGDDAAVDWMGGSPDALPDGYDAADPASRLRRRPPMPVVVLHGDRDEAVPVEGSRGLRADLDWLDYRELAGVGHLELIDPRSEVWPAVLAAVAGGGAHGAVPAAGGTLES